MWTKQQSNNTSAPTIMKKGTNDISASRKALLAGGLAVFVIVAACVGYYVMTNKKVPIKMPTTVQSQNKNSGDVNTNIKAGEITGNEVKVRTNPSTASDEITILNKGNKVQVIGVQECKDPKAGMINANNVSVSFGGARIKLKYGQAVSILAEQGNEYKCLLEVEDNSDTIYLNKNTVKKLLGEKWYKVKFDNGHVGWVYGSFVSTDFK